MYRIDQRLGSYTHSTTNEKHCYGHSGGRHTYKVWNVIIKKLG